jgi:hypothetical protein
MLNTSVERLTGQPKQAVLFIYGYPNLFVEVFMAGRLSAAEQERLEVDSYYNRSSSRTKPNSTLFISYRDVKPHVPKEERAVHAEGLFSAIQGYIGVRQVKGMCFVDFDGIKASTAGMMQYQGHNGLTIDYDKDAGVAGKRQRETDEKTARAQHAASSCSYFCVSCGTKALRTNGSLLGEFPVRGTDGAHVIDESKLDTLLLDGIPSAQPARVQRPKGVEKQWRLACRSCGHWIAYRSAQAVAPGSFLYVVAQAVREHPLSLAELQGGRTPRPASHPEEEKEADSNDGHPCHDMAGHAVPLPAHLSVGKHGQPDPRG